MRFGKLRIAWSFAWGIAALLLIVLWVRSHQTTDSLEGFTPRGPVILQYFKCESLEGQVTFVAQPSLRSITSATLWRRLSLPAARQANDDFGPLGFYYDGVSLSLPHWFVVLIAAALAATTWLRWRFSLRTLLIATTLVAVLLGLVVWLSQ